MHISLVKTKQQVTGWKVKNYLCNLVADKTAGSHHHTSSHVINCTVE